MRTISDPSRLEVLKNALEGMADGMALTVIRTARSSVVRSSLDFSTGVLSPSAELIGQGMCQPLHLGGMGPALKSCLERYAGRIYPGDVLASNDPYEGGSHLPDIFLYKPMYAGEKLLGFLCVMTHHTDIGGRVAGGNACDSTEIYQEGLRIPPLKLYERGEPNETLFRILEKAVRVPDMVLGDIMSNIAALHYGEQEYMKLIQRYGVEELEQHQEELVDYTEELTRKVIRGWPDGTWSFTDYVDDDGFDPGPIKVVVTVTKKDDELHVDFTGTSPQCKGAIQPVFDSTKGVVYGATKCLLAVVGANIPNTGGYMRPIKVTAPVGSFVNPLPPAPVAARAIGSVRIAQALFGAYAQMLPDKICACSGGGEVGVGLGGYDKSRAPWKAWVQLEFHNEQGVGAWPDKDGFDAQCAGMVAQLANNPCETLEAEQPLKIEQYGFRPDSEGAGKFRGGLGMVREYRCLMDDTVLQMRSERMKQQPYGLHGGQNSRPTRITLNQGGEERQMPSKFLVNLSKGDSVRIEWPGAGGSGPPLERDPEKVLGDVIAGMVSPQRARDIYGVVVDVEKRQVDGGATERRRSELRQKGGEEKKA